MSTRSQEQVTDPDDPLVDELAVRQLQWRLRHRHHDPQAAAAAALALVRGLLPSSRLFRTPEGVLWLGPDGEHTPVYDVHAPDPADVPRLRRLAMELAGSPLGTSSWPGEPSREAFVADAGFTLTATTMRLDVAGALPGEELADRVEPVAMSAAEVAAYRDRSVAAYAAEREAAGESAALAWKTSVASFDEILPGGRPGPDQHLFTVHHAGETVGVLWVCRRWPAQAWVYDVEVDAAHRGLGLGAATMAWAGRWARAQGLAWLGLNVFGHNTRARGLYERLGYVVEEEHWALASASGSGGRQALSSGESTE